MYRTVYRSGRDPPEMTLADGESHDLGDGYSITVTQIDLSEDKATFVLTIVKLEGSTTVEFLDAKSE